VIARTHRRAAIAAIILGTLYGCAAPPPSHDAAPPDVPLVTYYVAPTTTTTAPAPGQDAWHALPSDDDVYLEMVHAGTTTTTTAPPPTTVPARPPAPPAPPTATGPIADLICSYPWDCATALRVAECESGLNPRAVGSAGERGLFQVHPVHRAWLGARWDQLFDPAVNVAVAFEMWTTQGWGPWSCA